MTLSFYSILLAAALGATLLFSTGCASTETLELGGPEADCAEILCRDPMTVRLVTGSGETHETTFDQPLPIVIKGKAVTIFPGEEIFVEAEVVGGRLVNLQAVEAVRSPVRTLTLNLAQQDDGGMLFTAINPFPTLLKYHLQMMLPTSDALKKTSSCPVMPDGGFVFEHWPHPIFQLVLTDPRLDAEASRCEY